MTANQPDDSYAPGRSAGETQRLITQSQLYGRATRRLFEAAGIGPGLRVLDVGSGAGDVAVLAAELVGPTGAVVGVDSNTTILETARSRAGAAGLASVTFLAGDLQTVALDGLFDAVVGRMVLIYTADPVAALRSLVGHLRPGGVVAFQEADFELYRAYSQSDLCLPLQRQVIPWELEVFRRSGAHLSSGFGLLRAFGAVGLAAPDLSVFAPLGGTDNWAGFTVMADVQRGLLPRYEQFGIASAAEVDVDTFAERLRAEVRATGRPAMMLPTVCAWVRKASASGPGRAVAIDDEEDRHDLEQSRRDLHDGTHRGGDPTADQASAPLGPSYTPSLRGGWHRPWHARA